MGKTERMSTTFEPAIPLQSHGMCTSGPVQVLKQVGITGKGIPDEQNPDLAGICSSPSACSGLGNRCSLYASLLVLAGLQKTLTLKEEGLNE